MSWTGSFRFLGKMIFFWESLQKSIKIVDDHPKADIFVVSFKILFHGLIEVFICSIRTFDRAPVVTKNFTISYQSSLPLRFLIVFHGFDMAFQMNRLKVWCAGNSWNLFAIFPPSIYRHDFSFGRVHIDTQNSLASRVSFLAWWATEYFGISW